MIAAGSIDIDRSAQLYADLTAASDNLCVKNHLHLLYLVTPYELVDAVKPDWMLYMHEVSDVM